MTTERKVMVGGVAWLAFAIAARALPTSIAWTHAVLLFCAFVLFPCALDLIAEKRDIGRVARWLSLARVIHLPAAALLALACGLRPGVWAGLATFPWIVFATLLALAGVTRMLRDLWARPLDRLCVDVGMGYLFIGAMWLLADRGGVRPLKFDAEIVALTAVHFHFAGFLLPLASGLVLRHMPESRFAARAVVGIVLGVPAVALGITITQFGWTSAVEAAAGCGLALNAMAIAVLHVRWSMDWIDAPRMARVLIGIAGVTLFFAMILAAIYAVRAYVTPLPWLGLPQMRAIHGTVIAVGFGLCGMLGWWIYVTRSALMKN